MKTMIRIEGKDAQDVAITATYYRLMAEARNSKNTVVMVNENDPGNNVNLSIQQSADVLIYSKVLT